MKDAKTITVEVIQGPEGRCLSVDDRRVAGPKPWGGGSVLASWEVPLQQLLAALSKE